MWRRLMHRRADNRTRTPEEIVRAAWQIEIETARANKTTAEPDAVPCPRCAFEVHWTAVRCPGCGAAYDDDELRYRARIYEGLLWG